MKNLERQGRLRRQGSKNDYLNALLQSAYRNFQAAESNLNSFEEITFKATYDGLLQISRVVLLLNGYRPDDRDQHKTTFEVAGAILGKDFSQLIAKINTYRIKRNNCIYDAQGIVTKTEAENILRTAKEYWNKIKLYLKRTDPQLDLFDF